MSINFYLSFFLSGSNYVFYLLIYIAYFTYASTLHLFQNIIWIYTKISFLRFI